MTAQARYTPKFGVDIRVKREERARAPQTRGCDHPGCAEPGAHRAPKGREALREYHWFCLEHVRAYNERWDYFRGMSDSEIAAFQREALFGHRPTWKMGTRPPGGPEEASQAWFRSTTADPFDLFHGAYGDAAAAEPRREPERRLTRSQQDALSILDLDASVTLNVVKARYKELVKRFHPDANGGDRRTEARLQEVIRAYGHLKASGFFR